MAKNSIFIIEDEDIFIDESGRTSLEPEGAGHHPGGNAAPESHGDFQSERSGAEDIRGEERFDSDGGYLRDTLPVEGDGSGAPG